MSLFEELADVCGTILALEPEMSASSPELEDLGAQTRNLSDALRDIDGGEMSQMWLVSGAIRVKEQAVRALARGEPCGGERRG